MSTSFSKPSKRCVAATLLVTFVVAAASACEPGSAVERQVGRDVSKVGGAVGGAGAGGYAVCKVKGNCL